MRQKISSALFFLLVLCGSSMAEFSILEKISRVSESVVEVRVSGKGLLDKGQKRILDRKTGKIYAVKDLRMASFQSQASGVVVDPSGIVVTNAHVMRANGNVSLVLRSGLVLSAGLLAIYPQEDLVFLQARTSRPLAAIEFSDSSKVRLQDKVFTIGGSEVLEQTISQGKITGIGSSFSKTGAPGSPAGILQASFNIYKGDSGTPLLDKEGRFLGLMTAARPHQDRMAYSIPCNGIKEHLQRITKRSGRA